MNPLQHGFTRNPTGSTSPDSISNKRKGNEGKEEVIEEVATKKFRLKEQVEPKNILYYEFKVIDEQKTLSIKTFWGNFKAEPGKIDQSPEMLIKEQFSIFWEKKMVPALKENKAFHLKLGKGEGNEPLSSKDVVVIEGEENRYFILRTAKEEGSLIGQGDCFFVFQVKDVVTSEEFALAFHRNVGQMLLMPKQNVLNQLMNSEVIIGSLVRNGLEIKGSKKQPKVREMYLAPLVKFNDMVTLKKCQNLTQALERSKELLNQITKLHDMNYIHGDLNHGNILVVQQDPPIFNACLPHA